YSFTDDPRSADVLLYNTCSVRDHAEQKVYSRLGADARRKSAGKKLIVGVLGCMAQKDREGLARYPAVDIICAPGQIYRLCDMLAQAASSKGLQIALDPKRNEPVDEAARQAIDEMDILRDISVTPSRSQAFVRVMRGCDNFCTYCIVPYTRGPEASRSPHDVYEEVRRLVDAGRSEITLLGQTVNSYHHSAGGVTTGFADLLCMLSPIVGLRRLRFVTSHPMSFDENILTAMRDLPNVCHYMHVPAQSGSDVMLKAMNRGYTSAVYDELICTARSIVPDMVFAGDFIVGFPGETDEDHAASAELIRRTGYRNSFIFKYSPRPGTLAAKKYADDISEETKKNRNNELLAVQKEVSLVHHEAFVGRTLEVLVTGPSRRSDRQDSPGTARRMQMMGRTRGDHIVIFDGPESSTDTYRDVTITSAGELILFGELNPLA
ncbi:MAG TPA: tRNA (N6-isopentenyl adenosine(37)-C2)-methylthiotransferase MiaB, partial [Phycisphaerae bacterium]|nr:tRNA (N6-isopentenyl adenosine(37)-C2)-methylthiotransferase MiaB [Phycisphaerae bacterium]